MAGCGFPRTLPVAPYFNLPCTPIIRCLPVLDPGSAIGTMPLSLRPPGVGHRYLQHPSHSYQLNVPRAGSNTREEALANA